MECTGTVEGWEAGFTVVVPAQGESEHCHGKQTLQLHLLSNATC